MTVYFEPILNISTQKVRFYTIRFKNQSVSEYKKFCTKSFLKHLLEVEILKNTISKIGLRGAKPFYFEKPERGAFALPSVSPDVKKSNKDDYGLRLYCLYLSSEIVVLLNGGIKTTSNPRLCPNVQKYFDQAVKLAAKINKAKESDFVRYNGLELAFDTDFYLDI